MDVDSNPAGKSVACGIFLEWEAFEAWAVVGSWVLSVVLELGPRKFRAPTPPPMHRPAKTQGIQAGRLEGVWATGLLREDLFIGAGILVKQGHRNMGLRGRSKPADSSP